MLLTTSMVTVNAAVNPNANIEDANAPSNSDIVIYVDDDNTQGPWDGTPEHPYQYIQDGVDAAEDSDKVIVQNGIYTEDVNIEKSIELFGVNKDSTVIEGCVDIISTSSVMVQGFTIKGVSNNNLIRVYSSSQCIIHHNIINGSASSRNG